MGKRQRRRNRLSEAATHVSPDVITFGMTTEQIKAAGLAVDVPFEAPTSADLEYSDGTTLTESFPHLLEDDLGDGSRED